MIRSWILRETRPNGGVTTQSTSCTGMEMKFREERPVPYEYVFRQGGITVSSRVPVAGVPNITRRPIGLPSFDHGVPDRFDIQTWRGKLISMIGKWIRDKLKKPKPDRSNPSDKSNQSDRVIPDRQDNAGKKGPPNPAPDFESPINPPSMPPSELPEGHKVRVMPPTEQYPNGYWRQYNEYGQPVNPATEKLPSNVTRLEFRAQTHVPSPRLHPLRPQ